MAHSLGITRDSIVDVALAGLFHRIGTMTASVSVRAKGGTRLANASVARVLAQGGIGRASDTRAFIVAEQARIGLGRPEPTPEPHVLSRLVGVAVAYAQLIVGLSPDGGEPRSPLTALERLSAEEPSLDSNLVDLLINLVRAFPVGTEVLLDGGESALVVDLDPGGRWDRPVVRVEGENTRRLALADRSSGRFQDRIRCTRRFLGMESAEARTYDEGNLPPGVAEAVATAMDSPEAPILLPADALVALVHKPDEGRAYDEPERSPDLGPVSNSPSTGEVSVVGVNPSARAVVEITRSRAPPPLPDAARPSGMPAPSARGTADLPTHAPNGMPAPIGMPAPRSAGAAPNASTPPSSGMPASERRAKHRGTTSSRPQGIAPSSDGAKLPSLDSRAAPGSDRPAAPGSDRPAAPGSDRPAAPGSDRPAAPGSDRPAAPGSDRPHAATPRSGRMVAEAPGPSGPLGDGRDSDSPLASARDSDSPLADAPGSDSPLVDAPGSAHAPSPRFSPDSDDAPSSAKPPAPATRSPRPKHVAADPAESARTPTGAGTEPLVAHLPPEPKAVSPTADLLPPPEPAKKPPPLAEALADGGHELSADDLDDDDDIATPGPSPAPLSQIPDETVEFTLDRPGITAVPTASTDVSPIPVSDTDVTSALKVERPPIDGRWRSSENGVEAVLDRGEYVLIRPDDSSDRVARAVWTGPQEHKHITEDGVTRTRTYKADGSLAFESFTKRNKRVDAEVLWRKLD